MYDVCFVFGSLATHNFWFTAWSIKLPDTTCWLIDQYQNAGATLLMARQLDLAQYRLAFFSGAFGGIRHMEFGIGWVTSFSLFFFNKVEQSRWTPPRDHYLAGRPSFPKWSKHFKEWQTLVGLIIYDHWS